MTKTEIINILENDSCYECSWGTDGIAKCSCSECSLKDAVIEVVEALKASMYNPGKIEITTWNDTTRHFTNGLTSND